jgi:hypothetical protein
VPHPEIEPVEAIVDAVDNALPTRSRINAEARGASNSQVIRKED